MANGKRDVNEFFYHGSNEFFKQRHYNNGIPKNLSVKGILKKTLSNIVDKTNFCQNETAFFLRNYFQI